MSLTAAPATVSVARSRSNGRDALSVTASDGSDLGWYDLGADAGHPEDELFSLVIDAAGAGWRQGSGSPLRPGASALVGVRAEGERLFVYGYEGSELGWYDLSESQGHPASDLMEFVVQAAGLAYRVGQRSAPRTAGSTQLHVRRVGDTLQVTGYDGTDLGWFDLTTGSSHPASEIMNLVVEAAGLGWQACSRAREELVAPPEAHVAQQLGAHLEGLMLEDTRWGCWRVARGADALDVWLVVGPGGAFLACAAARSADESGGVSASALQSVLRLADQLTAHLSAAVRFPVPVPVVVTNFAADFIPQPAGEHAVPFLRGDCLPQWLRARRVVVDDAQLSLLTTHASRTVGSDLG